MKMKIRYFEETHDYSKVFATHNIQKFSLINDSTSEETCSSVTSSLEVASQTSSSVASSCRERARESCMSMVS